MLKITVGGWRTEQSGPMQVVLGPVGREHVHFEAPAAKRLETEMRGFLDWFNADQGQDPVIKAGLAHLWFVTIHPFEDGNGRIAARLAWAARLARAAAPCQSAGYLPAPLARSMSSVSPGFMASQQNNMPCVERG
jgi:Fic family protein